MAKAKRLRPATMAMKLDDAENRYQAQLDVNKQLQQTINAYDREEGRLANENTRLSKLVESLKEQLFYKSIALAQAEGQLQRVDHEDAERAEVVIVNDVRTSKVQHDGGFEVNGPAVPIQRAVLKYNLDRQPMRTTTYEELNRPSAGLYSSRETEKPKHWVNQS